MVLLLHRIDLLFLPCVDEVYNKEIFDKLKKKDFYLVYLTEKTNSEYEKPIIYIR